MTLATLITYPLKIVRIFCTYLISSFIIDIIIAVISGEILILFFPHISSASKYENNSTFQYPILPSK